MSVNPNNIHKGGNTMENVAIKKNNVINLIITANEDGTHLQYNHTIKTQKNNPNSTVY